MTHPENPTLGMHQQLEQTSILKEVLTPTYRHREVLDNLRADSFLQAVQRNMIEDPNGVTLLYVIGPSAVGKLTTSMQIATAFLRDKELRSKLKDKGKKLKIHYIDFPMALVDLQNKGEIPDNWGNHTVEEFSKAADHMRGSIDSAMSSLPKKDPKNTHIIIIKTPSTIHLDLESGLAINPIIPSPNTFALQILGDPSVQIPEVEDRKNLWEKYVQDEAELIALSERRSVVMDEYAPTSVRRYEIGNMQIYTRVEEAISQGAYKAKYTDQQLQDCPDFTIEELKQNPGLNQKVRHAYFKYLQLKWGLESDRCAIVTNENLHKKTIKGKPKKIHYYRGLRAKIALPLLRAA